MHGPDKPAVRRPGVAQADSTKQSSMVEEPGKAWTLLDKSKEEQADIDCRTVFVGNCPFEAKDWDVKEFSQTVRALGVATVLVKRP